MKRRITRWLMSAVAAAGVSAQAAAPIGETITLYSVNDAQYVKVDLSNGNELAANSGSAITATEQFVVVDAGGGKILLKAVCNNLYVQHTSDVNKLKAVGTSASNADNQWQWVEGTNGIINLKSVGNNKYVTPNNGGTLKADTASIGASTEFTWALAGGGAGTWRVIPEDARWPTDDVIVAFCDVTDAEFNLPANPTNTDCTAAFQAAVDACATAGGGTVFVPEGQYRLDGPLSVGNNVFLRGRWRELHAGDSGANLGTVIRCEKATLPSAVINFAGDGGVYDMTFWHPNQKPASGVTVYPTVIKGGSTHKNVTFLNAYEGIRLPGSSNDRVRGLYGSPLHMGLFSGPAFAVPGFTDINFSPDYLAWSGLETNQAELNAHAAYMYTNGTAVQHDGKAGFFANSYTISGYQCAVRFSNEQQVSNMPQGEFVDADISNCQMGIQFVTSEGVKIKNCNIHDCLDAINTTVWSGVKLAESSISGINYDVNANSASPDVTLLNSTWSGSPGKMKLNGGQVIVKTLRPEPARRIYDDYVRKPLKGDFFNVKATQYGAIGNGVTDDTAAILAAVADANANGGGIVFFPGGDYLIKSNLVLQAGVELRGALGGRQQIQGSSDGSTLRIDVPVGPEFGQAFITMGDYCGIRGLAFYYPNQTGGGTTGAFVKHPFTVRANGIRNYIIACSPINPYRFVEFNGDDSLFMYSYPCAIREVVRSSSNSNGRYEDNMGKAAHWPNGTFPCPETDKEVFIANTVKEGLTIFNIINCDEYNVNSSFWHGCFRGFTIDNSGGDFGQIHFEQCEQYAEFVGGSKHAILDVSGSQERRWGPVDDPDVFGIKLCEGFTGSVEGYDGGVGNEPYEMWDVQGGSLYLRSVGSSHSHGAVLTMRTGVKGSLFLEGATLSDTLIGIENQGSLKMLNCELGGINQPLAEEFGADNTFNNVNVLSDPGQNPIRDYGLVLNRNDIQLVYPDSRKNLTYATTTNGQFNFTADNPDTWNDSPNEITVRCEWIVQSNSTVELWYYGTGGWTKAGGASFTSNKDLFTTFKFNDPAFGQQGGADYPDMRIVVTGSSPKLRSVSAETPVYRPFAPKSPTGLAATGGASVLLDWDDNAEPGVSYNVYRRTASSGTFGVPLVTGLAASSFVDTTTVAGVTNYYVVTAEKSGRESGISLQVSAAAEGPLDPYDVWASAYGGPGVIGVKTNDYDSDRLNNLGEYALGGNPTNEFDVGEKPVLLNTGGSMMYIHPQRSDDASLIYTVETCTNLVSGVWTNAGCSIIGTNITGAILNYVTNDISTAEDVLFMRLKVEK